MLIWKHFGGLLFLGSWGAESMAPMLVLHGHHWLMSRAIAKRRDITTVFELIRLIPHHHHRRQQRRRRWGWARRGRGRRQRSVEQVYRSGRYERRSTQRRGQQRSLQRWGRRWWRRRGSVDQQAQIGAHSLNIGHASDTCHMTWATEWIQRQIET